jgi:hypothetical protein
MIACATPCAEDPGLPTHALVPATTCLAFLSSHGDNRVGLVTALRAIAAAADRFPHSAKVRLRQSCHTRPAQAAHM